MVSSLKIFRTKQCNSCFFHLPNVCYMPAHIILLDFITSYVIRGRGYKLWCSSLSSFLSPPVTSSPVVPCFFLSTLFSLNSFFTVRGQVKLAHAKQQVKIYYVYFNIYTYAMKYLVQYVCSDWLPHYADRVCPLHLVILRIDWGCNMKPVAVRLIDKQPLITEPHS